jgi:hypothetical protein
MKFLRWFIPALTGSVMLRLSSEVSGLLYALGIAIGGFYIFAAVVSAFLDYAKPTN